MKTNQRKVMATATVGRLSNGIIFGRKKRPREHKSTDIVTLKFRWLWLPLWRFSSQRTKEWKRSRAAESTKPIMTLAIRQRRRNECVPCSRSQRERLSSRRGNDNDAARWIFVIRNSSSMPAHGDEAGRRVMQAATPVGQSRFQCHSLPGAPTANR